MDKFDEGFNKFDEDDEWEERDLDRFLKNLKNLCPKCDHLSFRYRVREVNVDVALVDWFCKNCGHKWSNTCPFKDGKIVFDPSDGSS